jgi:hypothetical protein
MKTKTAIGMAVLGAGAWLARELAGDHARREEDRQRWLVVTVNRAPHDIARDRPMPGPLGELADQVEIQIRPAPADKGTELAARFRDPVPEGETGPLARLKGDAPHQQLRAALRATKSILECGEVVQPDTPWTTKPTPTGRLIGLATARARSEGVL